MVLITKGLADKKMRVVNIIPTYNEKENIGKMLETLEKIAGEVKKDEFLTLVVDANSTDGTQEIVKKFIGKNKKIFLLTGPKKGLGHDLIRGYRYAMEKLRAEIVIPNDADFQWNPHHIPEMLRKIEQGYDVVVASRHIKGGGTENWGGFRKLNHWLANDFFAGFVAGVKEIKDHSGCFKAIRVKNHLDRVNLDNLNVKGFVIQNEILYQLSKTGAKFTEVPVKFKERERGVSKLGFNKQYLKDIFEWIKSCLLIRFERSQQFFKFGVVGFVGYLINASTLHLFASILLWPEWLSWALSTELSIISNFTFNNLWTFEKKQIRGVKKILNKFLHFNLTSAGALGIMTGVGTLGVKILGPQYRQILLPFIIVFLVVPYNYFMYTHFIWKTKKIKK